MKIKRKWIYVLVVISVIFVAVTPFVIRARLRSHRICCNCNLKQIGTGCYLSMDDFDGYFPPSFGAMHKYGNAPAMYACPEAKHAPKTMNEVNALSSYIYISGLRPDDPGNCALALDHPDNHGGEGGNVLFVDGHVEWVEQAVLERLVREPWAGQEVVWPAGGPPLDEQILDDLKARIVIMYQGKETYPNGLESTSAPPAAGTLETHP